MSAKIPQAPFILGSSLKMYMGHQSTLDWVRGVRDACQNHPAVRSGLAEVFLLPSHPAIVPSRDILVGSDIKWGAQDVFWEDSGAYTGEVGAPQLREIGCTYIELGHAERRRVLGETDAIVSAKTYATFRNGLIPVLCIGEDSLVNADAASLECIRQLDASLEKSREAGAVGPVVIAYEPIWAIGAAESAHPEYIRDVVGRIRGYLTADASLVGSRVIYGGSAGPGLLTRLGDGVDGLFLGRFGHDPDAFALILDEAWEFSQTLANQVS
ncbi:triose-phosphate isomerase family protein [Cryobacterium sp. Y62]|uniref:triose-phosphate isomerase family protein n=1 Tax=Cryobacterium sp. Y62 TaxID=2048284 RepID=UPI000CE4190A|nr:triose-phosphate isomerase family protein [Cryobacterium sp. Y62]